MAELSQNEKAFGSYLNKLSGFLDNKEKQKKKEKTKQDSNNSGKTGNDSSNSKTNY